MIRDALSYIVMRKWALGLWVLAPFMLISAYSVPGRYAYPIGVIWIGILLEAAIGAAINELLSEDE